MLAIIREKSRSRETKRNAKSLAAAHSIKIEDDESVDGKQHYIYSPNLPSDADFNSGDSTYTNPSTDPVSPSPSRKRNERIRMETTVKILGNLMGQCFWLFCCLLCCCVFIPIILILTFLILMWKQGRNSD
ncbi:unnamed protein product [Orchesella dallaii]|uniref:Uncharacterized protein n=1 Tax=Orchesella dallaii TaxID=48710 RepID=A0ABP1QR99_9HEXA